MARKPDDSDGAAIRAALQALFLADRAAGRRRTRDEYLARFPGFEAEVDAELRALDAHRRRGESAEAGNDETVDDGTDGPRAFSAVLEAGCRLGPHVLLRSLGRGGQGEVWAVRHEGLGREVALKLLLDPGLSGQQVFQRFVLEARSLASLRHPAVIRVHDTGTEGGYAYLSMDLLPGGSLKDAIDRRAAQGPPDLTWTRKVTAWCEVLAHGLHHAHQHRLLHRDVKPANILLDEDGHPVLVDFGLAKRLDDDGAGPTATHVSLGTRDYMSPEQLGGGSVPLDQRSDVYSLGLVLYELLTLERAHADAPSEVRRGLAHRRTPTPVRRLNPHVSRDLERVLQKALAFERADRYDTAQDLALDLVRVREDRPVLARPAGPLRRVVRWAQRSPLVASGLFAVLAVLIGSLVAVNAARIGEGREKRRADRQVLVQAYRAGDLDGLAALVRDVPLEDRGFVWGLLADLVRPRFAWAELGEGVEELRMVRRGDRLALASVPAGKGHVSTIEPRRVEPVVPRGDSVHSLATVDPTGSVYLACTPLGVFWGRVLESGLTGPIHVAGSINNTRPILGAGGSPAWLVNEANGDLARAPSLEELDALSPWGRLSDPDGEVRAYVQALGVDDEGRLLVQSWQERAASNASTGSPGPGGGSARRSSAPVPSGRLDFLLVDADLETRTLLTVEDVGRVRAQCAPDLDEVVYLPWFPDDDGNRWLVRTDWEGERRRERQIPGGFACRTLAVGRRRVVLGSKFGELWDFDRNLDPGEPVLTLPGGSITGLLLEEHELDDPDDDVLWASTASGVLHRIELGEAAEVEDCGPGSYFRLYGTIGSSLDTLWTVVHDSTSGEEVPELQAWSAGTEGPPTSRGARPVTLDPRDPAVLGDRLYTLDADKRVLLEIGPDGTTTRHPLPDPGVGWWKVVPFLRPGTGFGLESQDRFLVWGPGCEGVEDLVEPELLEPNRSSLWIDGELGWNLSKDEVTPLTDAARERPGLREALEARAPGIPYYAIDRSGTCLVLTQEQADGVTAIVPVDLKSGRQGGRSLVASATVLDLQISGNGEVAAVLYNDGSLVLWDVTSGDIELHIGSPDFQITDFHLDPDLRWIALADDAHRLRIWHSAPPDAPVGLDAFGPWKEAQKDDVSGAPTALEDVGGPVSPGAPGTGGPNEPDVRATGEPAHAPDDEPVPLVPGPDSPPTDGGDERARAPR